MVKGAGLKIRCVVLRGFKSPSRNQFKTIGDKMNIFILDKNPRTAATMMIDKHVIKMPLESLQMISTNLDYLGFNSPYRPVMLLHPCTLWAKRSKQNMQWLVEHFKSLCIEYTLRYDKIHKCQQVFGKYEDEVNKMIDSLQDKGLTPFAIAIGDDMQCRQTVSDFDTLSAVDKYRLYYLLDKRRIAEWKTKAPQWWLDYDEAENKYGI